ncbi:hypothetical protein FSP39_017710 [Pinctada imbricata]|uniref:Rho-GAP domain-containing protein n=1 Tax=Pinctada imbricata TaxID=66713 RepID=A0AA88YIW9_PINIB|nr:hypothetical protein FSP39_017710 [Pinctada imbricata]
MTVHGPRSKSVDKMKSLDSHQNGYIGTMMLSQDDEYVDINRSWNGLVFQVTPYTNGIKPGFASESSDSQDSPQPTSDSKPKFTIGDDSDGPSLYDYSTYEKEPIYVTLDNNYLVPSSLTPNSRHLSLLDFKRNQLNNSTHSEKSKPIRSAQSQVFVDRNKNIEPSLKTLKRRSLKKIAENIGSVLSFSPKKDGNPKLFSAKQEETFPKRERSKSVGDLEVLPGFQSDGERKDSESYSDDEEDDDVDGDDFGFLSYSFSSSSFLPPAMNRSKSPVPTHRILPRIRKSKTKAIPCMWSSQGNCTWSSVSGRKVVLRPFNLLQVTEPEKVALQKIALQKLQSMNLGCSISIPKDSTEFRRHKRQILSFKRSKSANLSSLIDRVKADKENENKDHQPVGLVFGISLAKCIANDLEIQKKRQANPNRNENDDVIIHRRDQRKSSTSSSQGSLDNVGQNGNTLSPDDVYKRAASTDSLSESDCSRHTTNSSLVDALSLSTSRKGSFRADHLPHTVGNNQVPQIVQLCFKHIESYGLQVLGIFRVGSSKKRVKQLRDEFDSGKEINLNDTHNPHDVGALLKEYFRDLPEALLTRDLYSAFVATRKLSSHEKQVEAMQFLVDLLPVPNRDTLWSLLHFLSIVDEHSKDSIDVNGEVLPGNKMDSNNLATLFGPNILHKVKSTEKEFQVESKERAEERKEVIEVIKDMIDNFELIFQVQPEVHDDVLKSLQESDPEAVDDLLKAISSNDMGIEPDLDTTSSSILEDSDTASLPHSPCSEMDLSSNSQRNSALHPPLRNSNSEEIMTPKTRRRFFFSSGDGNKQRQNRTNNNDSESERKPRFRMRLDRSPSPSSPRSGNQRPPKVKISQDKSSPEANFVRRSRSDYTDRPRSENYSNCLAIPKINYARQNSATTSQGSLVNSSPSDSPISSECSGHYVLPTPPASGSNSPKSSRKMLSSRQRPLGLLSGQCQQPTWEKERWRQWELLAAENADDSYEKETLV